MIYLASCLKTVADESWEIMTVKFCIEIHHACTYKFYINHFYMLTLINTLKMSKFEVISKYEGCLKSSWTHIIPSRNFVEVR